MIYNLVHHHTIRAVTFYRMTKAIKLDFSADTKLTWTGMPAARARRMPCASTRFDTTNTIFARDFVCVHCVWSMSACKFVPVRRQGVHKRYFIHSNVRHQCLLVSILKSDSRLRLPTDVCLSMCTKNLIVNGSFCS